MDMMAIKRMVMAQMVQAKQLYVATGTFTPSEDLRNYTLTHNLGKIPKYIYVEIQSDNIPNTPQLIVSQIIGTVLRRSTQNNPAYYSIRCLYIAYNSAGNEVITGSTGNNNNCSFGENTATISNTVNSGGPYYMSGYTYKWTAYAWDD